MDDSLAIVTSILYHQESNMRKRSPWMSQLEEIEILKEAIENLKKEKQRLEEADDLVKKSIKVVANKRLLVQQKKQDDIYIIVTNEYKPTHEEMKEAGLEGWEWITVY